MMDGSAFHFPTAIIRPKSQISNIEHYDAFDPKFIAESDPTRKEVLNPLHIARKLVRTDLFWISVKLTQKTRFGSTKHIAKCIRKKGKKGLRLEMYH
jgi:hypothetical protein